MPLLILMNDPIVPGDVHVISQVTVGRTEREQDAHSKKDYPEITDSQSVPREKPLTNSPGFPENTIFCFQENTVGGII